MMSTCVSMSSSLARLHRLHDEHMRQHEFLSLDSLSLLLFHPTTVKLDDRNKRWYIPDDDAVLDGEAVGGKTSDVPGPNLDLVSQRVTQRELLRCRDSNGAHLFEPYLDLVLFRKT